MRAFGGRDYPVIQNPLTLPSPRRGERQWERSVHAPTFEKSCLKFWLVVAAS
jgi:hypothetical protein